MDTTYWQKQGSEPLFPELEWNKPQRRDQAGRLLIIGGNVHSLTAPAKAYELARQAGAGEISLVLPDATKRLIGKVLPEALFLPSTKSGEFSHEASVELLEYSQWADLMFLPGDVGRNSQTTILFEELIRSSAAPLVITRDAVDILSNHPKVLLERPHTTLVVSFSQLQKLAQNYKYPTALTFNMDLVKLVDFLHNFTSDLQASFITLHHNQLIVGTQGKISTTKLSVEEEPEPWRLAVASSAACYNTWNPSKPFESLTYSTFLAAQQAI